MSHNYPKILLFVLFYLLGRVSLVTHYTIGEEDKRFINYQTLPHHYVCENSIAFKKEKQAPAVKRKYQINLFANYTLVNLRFRLPPNVFPDTFFIYSGHYIDPPKLA